MKQTEWLDTWRRITARFPKWEPTQVEAEDFCLALRGYNKDMVEEVSRWVRQQYTSQTPAIKWFVVECEKRKKDQQQKNQHIVENQSKEQEIAEWESQRENSVTKLEETPVEDLRKAYTFVMKQYGHLITKPENGNPRDWAPTLRSLVFCQLYGERK